MKYIVGNATKGKPIKNAKYDRRITRLREEAEQKKLLQTLHHNTTKDQSNGNNKRQKLQG